MNTFPRRSRLDQNVKAELKIREAIDEVEKLGADEKLTDSVVKLSEALNRLSDYVDDNLGKFLST